MSSRIKTIIFLFFMFFANKMFAQDTPGFTFGGHKNDTGFDIIQSSDEGYLICGSTRSFGEGSSDIITIKLDNIGNIEFLPQQPFESLHLDGQSEFFKGPFDMQNQFPMVKRLGQIGIGAAPHGLHGALNAAVRGKDNDRQ